VAAVGGAPVVADWVGVDVGQSQGRSGTANRSSHEKLGPTNHILLCDIVTAFAQKVERRPDANALRTTNSFVVRYWRYLKWHNSHWRVDNRIRCQGQLHVLRIFKVSSARRVNHHPDEATDQDVSERRSLEFRGLRNCCRLIAGVFAQHRQIVFTLVDMDAARRRIYLPDTRSSAVNCAVGTWRIGRNCH
jgi:hypothetical protein